MEGKYKVSIKRCSIECSCAKKYSYFELNDFFYYIRVCMKCLVCIKDDSCYYKSSSNTQECK